jgi:hypothetical protein
VDRLIVLVRSPYHLSPAEAEDWLRGQACELGAVVGVQRAVLSRLATPSERSSTHWSWLIELHCEAPGGVQQAVEDRAWKVILGDLRLLGMQPSVALVTESTDLKR